jgi:hypothetical protein
VFRLFEPRKKEPGKPGQLPVVSCIQNGRLPFLATILEPVLKLLGDIAQAVLSDSLALVIGLKETDNPLGLTRP